MNKKGLLPLVILIPLLIIGIIFGFFVLRFVLKTVINIALWFVAFSFVALIIYIIYIMIIKFEGKKRKSFLRKRIKRALKK